MTATTQTAAAKKSPPRTVWTGFRDGKQTIEVSQAVAGSLAECADFVAQLAIVGDDDAKEIKEKLTAIATRYGKE